jgi:hypothetical protein
MGYFEFIDRIKKMDSLIHCEKTGNAKELGLKLKVSRRTVFDYINIIREKGGEIKFDNRRKTFYYTNSFKLDF